MLEAARWTVAISHHGLRSGPGVPGLMCALFCMAGLQESPCQALRGRLRHSSYQILAERGSPSPRGRERGSSLSGSHSFSSTGAWVPPMSVPAVLLPYTKALCTPASLHEGPGRRPLTLELTGYQGPESQGGSGLISIRKLVLVTHMANFA